MPFDALLFDFDGLIADTETAWYETWRDAFARYGGRLELATYVACVGTVGLEPEDDLAALTGPDALPEVLRAMDAEAATRCRGLRPRPGVAEIIAEGDRYGMPRAIVSSSGRDWIEGLLESFGIAEGWSRLICADGDESVAKPDPYLYRQAIEELSVDPLRALAFEDSPNGVRAAKGAGLRCVAVPNPITAALDLSRADLVLPSLSGVTLTDLSAQLA